MILFFEFNWEIQLLYKKHENLGKKLRGNRLNFSRQKTKNEILTKQKINLYLK